MSRTKIDFPRVERIIAVPELRWACKCGRFLAERDFDEEDYFDPINFYYGIGTRYTVRCSRCGVHDDEPRLVEVGFSAVLTLQDTQ